MTSLTTTEVIGGRDLTGNVVVVTGATAGIGLETARALASAGAELVLTGRDQTRLDQARGVVAEGAAVEPHTVLSDLTDLASVQAGAERVAGLVDRIDILVNNAGVMFTPFEQTAQGHELQFGTNHLGHFLFTVALEPLLRRGAPSRVVNLSSGGHKIADIDLTDVDWRRRTYDKFQAYGAAKTANVLFTVELDRRWAPLGVRAFAVHPGNVLTELARHMDRDDMREMAAMSARASEEAGKAPARMQFVTPAEGAVTSVWAAVSETLADRGGLYLADAAVSDDVEPWAIDPDRAAELWQLSEELVAPFLAHVIRRVEPPAPPV